MLFLKLYFAIVCLAPRYPADVENRAATRSEPHTRAEGCLRYWKLIVIPKYNGRVLKDISVTPTIKCRIVSKDERLCLPCIKILAPDVTAMFLTSRCCSWVAWGINDSFLDANTKVKGFRQFFFFPLGFGTINIRLYPDRICFWTETFKFFFLCSE